MIHCHWTASSPSATPSPANGRDRTPLLAVQCKSRTRTASSASASSSLAQNDSLSHLTPHLRCLQSKWSSPTASSPSVTPLLAQNDSLSLDPHLCCLQSILTSLTASSPPATPSPGLQAIQACSLGRCSQVSRSSCFAFFISRTSRTSLKKKMACHTCVFIGSLLSGEQIFLFHFLHKQNFQGCFLLLIMII